MRNLGLEAAGLSQVTPIDSGNPAQKKEKSESNRETEVPIFNAHMDICNSEHN